MCKEVLDTKTFTMSAAEIKKAYINTCSDGYTYEKIARDPDKYKGKYAKIRGEVIQVIEDGNYYWSDTILVIYTKQSSKEFRILEDDIITMYGQLGGIYTYETVMGNPLTVPILYAEYVSAS